MISMGLSVVLMHSLGFLQGQIFNRLWTAIQAATNAGNTGLETGLIHCQTSPILFRCNCYTMTRTIQYFSYRN
jgi:hypothetical protein